MLDPKHRLVIDTNLWISFLLTRDLQKIDKLLTNKTITLLFSQELLDEFTEVAQRRKFRRYFSLTDLQDLLEQIDEYGEFVTVISTVDKCRDEKDNFLLALAIDGQATHILTGDKDLLVLQPLGNIQILTVANYLAS